MKVLLEQFFKNGGLTFEQSREAVEMMANNKCTPEQMGTLLGGLRMKGESPEEISGFASYLVENSIPLPTDREDLIDTCGTGGDGANTFNISTTVAFVVAASGIGVAKHGNRSVSSQCGSADVLDELGVPTDLSPEIVAKSIKEINYGFLFAPSFHPAFKNIVPVRKSIGVRTIFNILGPLVNPARVKKQVVGVFDSSFLLTMGKALRNLNAEEAMIVASNDGLDEISINAPTQVAHLKDGKVRKYAIFPEDAGLSRSSLEMIAGGDARKNADILLKIIKGEDKTAKRDIVLINAAAALLVAGKVESLKEGADMAGKLIDDGHAFSVFEKAKKYK